MLSSAPPFPLVISAASGTGKTTVVSRLVQAHPDVFHVSVSATTRPSRGDEIHGVHYHFVSHGTFQRLIEEDRLLEWARVHDHFYGTPRAELENGTQAGRITLLDIDVQGGMQVMSSVPGTVAVFLMPPSMEVLASRLRLRGTDDDATMAARLGHAPREIEQAMSAYDYLVMNDELDRCVDTVWAIIMAERARTRRLGESREPSKGA